MLVVSFFKPVELKLKILDGRKLEYYKSMGGTTKKGRRERGHQILKLHWGLAKDGEHDF